LEDYFNKNAMILIKKYWLGLVFAVIIILTMIHKIQITELRSNALKKTILSVGKVEGFENNRGITLVDVQYSSNGKIMHSSFGTYNVDLLASLQKGTKIWIKVSSKKPEYIEYDSLFH